MKTSELTGTALDWAVAKCEVLEVWREPDGMYLCDGGEVGFSYRPSTDWAQGGPIIEREEISIEFGRAEFVAPWIAYKLGLPDEDNPQGGRPLYVLAADGPTPLVAAMRCYVASKLGDEVSIPEGL